MGFKEVVGNIWEYHAKGNTICITTNGTLKKNGNAVMGAGVAKQAATVFPDIRQALGEEIADKGNELFFFQDMNIINFPVKHNWYENADIELIKKSCKQLQEIANFHADTYGRHINLVKFPIILPRPGCGNGKLDWEIEVKPVLQKMLDDKIMVISNE